MLKKSRSFLKTLFILSVAVATFSGCQPVPSVSTVPLIEELPASGTATPSVSPSLEPTPTPTALPSPTATPSTTLQRRIFFSGANSPFARQIPANATYTKEPRITSIRPNYEDWSMPIYRVNTKDVPLVKVYNDWGRSVDWPIPTTAQPAKAEDGHMAIVDWNKGIVYEMGGSKWQGTDKVHTQGMKDFPLKGDGISNPARQRVTAAGFAVSAGMVVREDFLTSDGTLTKKPSIEHALTIGIPHEILKKNGFIPPAVGGEAKEDSVGDIPLGTHYALPKDADIDSLQVHPLTKAMAEALQKYGAYAVDRNNAQQVRGGYVGNVRVEVGLIQSVYGVSNDTLLKTIEKEMADIIAKYGLFRVTVNNP